MKNNTFYVCLIAMVVGLFSCENSSNESDYLEDEQTSNLVIETGSLDFWYNDEVYSVEYKIFEDETIEYIESEALSEVLRIQESQPTLVEVNGLDSSDMVYMFNSEEDFHKYVRNAPGDRGCAIQKLVLQECGGGGSGGGGGGGGSTSNSLYTSQNLRIYVDSYLNKEADWTSGCYYYTGSTANKNRMKDFNKNETSAWRFRNGSQSCFPSGISNMSDKLSSLQVSPSISVVTLYQDHNYKGRSKKFYRRDVGLKDPEDHGGYPYWFIDFDTKWMVIGRLKNFKIGFFELTSWDDRVSSIKLN
ncbi:hypothetical protein [uncultured Croceitalea sp.]|uniref:hypothetical protein n=1 Tax=uncultured Croceitalea sp. TaxID=1798908 RepID=UPI003305E8E3